MPVSDWFKARESRKYTQAQPDTAKADVADGVWVKCPGCKKIVYQGELDASLYVCPYCGHHFEVPSDIRIPMLVDEGAFDETDGTLAADDPLKFIGAKPYTASLASAREKSGLREAVVTGRARMDGREIVLAVMDFRFIGASMGSVVGEKVARAFELALSERKPLLLVASSGGARMQEGMLSLMQMAKTAAAARKLRDANVPYIAVLGNPTYGGVTASFATLADVILAEPGARIGFAGPVVIEQSIRQKLPKGFQTAESLMKHGQVDMVVPREDLRGRLVLLLDYLGGGAGATSSPNEGGAR